MASPSGYDKHYTVETPRGDSQVGIGLDTTRGAVDRFLVQLQYDISLRPRRSVAISRIDHNPTSIAGHDLYAEGLHVDVTLPDGSEGQVWPPHSPLPEEKGSLIRACIEYYCSNVDYFVQVYEGKTRPNDTPRWP